MTEWLDVYDSHGRATGRVQPRDQVGGEDDYYLMVRIWVREAGGRLLVTQRQRDRFWYPSCWECPGGFAQAGETGFVAARRELAEETGLEPEEKAWRLLGDYIYEDIFSQHRYHAIVASYLVQLAEEMPDICPQAEEVAGWLWVPGEDYTAFQEERPMEPFTPASFQLYSEQILTGFPKRKG